MSGRTAVVAYVVSMVVVIVGLDVVVFRHQLLARFLANVGVVLVFGAFYLRFRSVFGGA